MPMLLVPQSTMRRFSLFILIILISLALIGISPTYAGPRDQPNPLPGWTHSPRFADDTSQQHGIVLAGKPIERGSPLIAEVDGNTSNGNEVVVGGRDGRVYVYKANGTLLWSKNVPIVGCADTALINGQATVGLLNPSDTYPSVLIGYGGMITTNRACDGGVIAYRGSDGATVWNFSQRTFDDNVTPEGPEQLYGVMTSPALADVDGNGTLEVAFGGFDRNFYMLNSNGSVRWYYHAADTIWSSPLFTNIDGDNDLEIIVATDISANPNIVPPTQDGGFLHAFDTQQRSPVRIAFQTGYIWRVATDQVLYSSPVEADLLASNTGTEIAIGSGCYFPTSSSSKRGKWIKIFRPSDGALLQTLNAPACVQSSPAVGDIDDDGLLEIVATVSGDASIGGDGKSDIVAWDPTNANPKWTMSPGDPNSGSNDAFGGDLQSPVIADLDGNGSLEVIAANFWSVHILRGSNGQALTYQGTSGPSLSLFAWGTLKSTPAVGDINNDGKLDLVIGGMNVNNDSRVIDHGLLYAWTDFHLVLGSSAGSQRDYSVPWPQFRRDARARAVFTNPDIVVSYSKPWTMIIPTGQQTLSAIVTTGDHTPLSWTAALGTNPNGLLTLTTTSGTYGDALQFQVHGNGRALGTYTGTIIVSAPDLPDKEITVTVEVVETVHSIFLPLVVR